MDIVPSASNASFPLEDRPSPIEVPYVATFTYDFGDFEGFPERLGFAKDGQFDLKTRSIEDCASLLQSWLYFGLICEFTKQPIEVRKFVHPGRQEERREILRWNPCGDETITKWENALDFREPMDAMNNRLLEADFDRINSVLHYAASCTLELEQLQFAQTPPLPVISLSIKILVEYLFDVLQRQFRKISNLPLTAPYLPVSPYGSDEMPASTKLLLSRMTDQGWCPSRMHSSFKKGNHYTLFFLSQLNRRVGEQKGHDNCTAHQCVSNNVDMSHYETKHRTPSCRCNFVEVPKPPLIEIIKSGGIPLVSVHTGPHNSAEIRIEKANPSTRYTAISHVWSDGLGNPNSNALPQCQLEWLSTCLERLPSHGYQGIYYNLYDRIEIDIGGLDAISRSNIEKPVPLFWMDTLCIPIDNEYAELRMKAINKMAATYAQATRTLILDSELQSLRIAVLETVEVLARIAHCAWAGRSWTLQEGAISPTCYFQCADGALQLDDINQLNWLMTTSASGNAMSLFGLFLRELGKIIREEGWSWVSNKQSAPVDASPLKKLFLEMILDDFQVRRKKTDFWNDTSTMGISDAEQNSRFVTVWNELSRRTTTKFEDIYIIVANLLDFNAGQIMKLPAEERMKTILWSGRYIPLSLLYNDGPRVSPGKNYRERWVPSTPRGSTLKPFPKLEFVADGLLLPSSAEKHTTMVLSQCLYINGYCFMVNAKRQKTYLVKAIRADPDEFQTDSRVSTCCIFEKAEGGLHNGSSPELKGTCLSITDTRKNVYDYLEDCQMSEESSSKATTRLVAIYDCPIRVWEVERSGIIPVSELKEYELLYKTGSAPIVRVECLTSQWEIILQTETSRLDQPYPRRPFPVAPIKLKSLPVFLALSAVFLGLPFNLLLTVKWVRRLGTLSHPSIAAIFFFYLADITLVTIPLAIIANCLNMAFGSLYQMRQIFIWEVLQICVLYFPAVLLGMVWSFSLKRYTYAAWLSTFDEDWTGKDGYTLWWKLIGFEFWLCRTFYPVK